MFDQLKELCRSPSNYEALRFTAATTLGAVLLGLFSLTFAGTVIFLILAASFLLVFSLILVPAALILVFSAAGFLFSVGGGTRGLAAMFWLYKKACGQHMFGEDQLDFARMRTARKAWDMRKELKRVDNLCRTRPMRILEPNNLECHQVQFVFPCLRHCEYYPNEGGG
ncbi:hypothetical protein BC332_02967 [Capsicum chinense]|uniref:Oleosin n=1 Tax=Capsicum annuum TaxID=4072 RepID=A0A2G3ALZ6_CAPAN|nr:hypothetical protein T459_03120 [Capsicum annuum]PHU30874.1 hypothetical protein BC332_02967 [Capsicum chinense]